MKRKYDRVRVRGKIIRLRKRLQKPTVFGALKTPGSDVRDEQAWLIRCWLLEDQLALEKRAK